MMANDLELYVRLTLFEYFNDGVPFRKAFKKIVSGLGPNAINEVKVHYLYRQFKEKNFKIADDASKEDKLLIENGTFFKAQHAFAFYSGYGQSIRKSLGIDERFSFHLSGYGNLSGSYGNYIFDIFNGKQKMISWDTTEVRDVFEHGVQKELVDACFIDDNQVLGILRLHFKTYLFRGTFNLTYCQIKVQKSIELDVNNRYFRYYLSVNDATNQVFLVMWPWRGPSKIATIDITDCNLSLNIRLMSRASFEIIQVDDIFLRGRRYVNAQWLWESSLIDQVYEQSEMQQDQQSEIVYHPINSEYVWAKDRLFTVKFHEHTNITTVFEYDHSELKWEKTNMQVKGEAQMFLSGENLLTLISKTTPGDHFRHFHYYQFQIGKTDKLSNMIWRSMRQYDQFNPKFADWFLSKIPKNSRFQSLT